ncbi:MAG: type II secretion system F family protein [Kiloniellales bacterium]
MAGASALIAFAGVWSTLLHRDPAARRARVIAAQRDRLRAGLLTPRRRGRQTQSMSMMRRAVEHLRLLKTGQSEKVTLKLARAGLRSTDAMIGYLFCKVALPFVFGSAAVILLYVFDVYHMQDLQKLMVSATAVVVGSYAPDIYIKNIAQKRQEKIRRALPDGLDLMVICAEAGLSLDATLVRVSTEMAKSQPELSDEFGLTAVELGFLSERQQALQNLSNRTDISSVRGMVNTMIQAERYGTPLAHSLRILSAESREERMLKAEEKAARLPALLTVPMIIFILPPLFVVLLGPAILDIIDALRGLGY